MTWSHSADGHLYVYWRGVLIWKKWQQYSMIFDSIGLPWTLEEQ